MAKIQTKKININDFSVGNKEDISKLARSLNPFFDDVERAMRKGLTVDENLPMQYQTITVEVDTLGNPKQKITFKTTLTKVLGCVTIRAVCADSLAISTPFISFSQNNSVIEVINITGLPMNKIFTLTLLLVN